MIERIFTRLSVTGTTQEHQTVRVMAGAGIEGDRYFGRHDEPGQNITLIEVEVLERFNAEHGTQHDPSLAGRNLYTWTDYTGIDPEVNLFSANTVARGVEFGTSPIPRMYSFGITLNF